MPFRHETAGGPQRFGQVARLIVLCLATAVLLAESYGGTARLSAWPPWVAAAAVHSLLAAFVLGALGRRAGRRSVAGWFRLEPWSAFLPAAAVLAGSAALALASHVWHGGGQNAAAGAGADGLPLAWLTWIPVVEELVFRLGLGRVFQRLAPGYLGMWFSALAFALVHADPTLARLVSGQVGLALGPFLLGLGCEVLTVKTGRILPAVALHMACNTTVLIFATLDGRWLSWLSFLYS